MREIRGKEPTASERYQIIEMASEIDETPIVARSESALYAKPINARVTGKASSMQCCNHRAKRRRNTPFRKFLSACLGLRPAAIVVGSLAAPGGSMRLLNVSEIFQGVNDVSFDCCQALRF